MSKLDKMTDAPRFTYSHRIPRPAALATCLAHSSDKQTLPSDCVTYSEDTA